MPNNIIVAIVILILGMLISFTGIVCSYKCSKDPVSEAGFGFGLLAFLVFVITLVCAFNVMNMVLP